ncbi:MAG: hypothetical protein LBD08_05580 [Treponema sp.]|jgi:hypothetical protein|nr:hypothetical protein [Treponema sp.]
MDAGEVLYISTRLTLGAAAAFFAIMVWSKVRDLPWMLMVMGVIAVYLEAVYSILEIFGIFGQALVIGSVPAASILFHNLPVGLFLAAFVVMASQKYRKQ